MRRSLALGLPALVLATSFALVTAGCAPAGADSDAAGAPLETAEIPASFTWPVLEGGFAESFPFPLPWAAELPYRGGAEVRWAGSRPFTTTSPTYFSYSFAWLLEDAVPFQARQLESDLADYYRGLARTFDAAHFDAGAHAAEVQGSGAGFLGVVHTVDPFNASRPLDLHLEGENIVCGTRSGVLLSLSPHTPGDALWKTLSNHRRTFACASR